MSGGFSVGDRVVFTHPTGIDEDDDEDALVGRLGVVKKIETKNAEQPILVIFEVIDGHPHRSYGGWWCDPLAIQKVREDET